MLWRFFFKCDRISVVLDFEDFCFLLMAIQPRCCVDGLLKSCVERGRYIEMGKIYIVMYHYVRELTHSRYPRIKGMDIRLFRRQIDYLTQNFSVVTMEQVMEAASGGGRLPERSMLLTFDDAYMDHYTYVLPILEEYGIQGSFFIPGKTFTTHQLLDVNKVHFILASADENRLLEDILERMDHYRGAEFDYPSNKELFREYAVPNRFDNEKVIFVKRMLQTALPERVRNRISSDLFEKYVGVTEEQLAYELYMTFDQLMTMKRHGMYIGVHGYDHYWLGELEQQQMQEDILKGLEVMAPFIDRKRWVMNYPYGSYNEEVLKYVRKEGACLGLTTKVGSADLRMDERLELPRFDCNDFPPKSEHYLEIG